MKRLKLSVSAPVLVASVLTLFFGGVLVGSLALAQTTPVAASDTPSSSDTSEVPEPSSVSLASGFRPVVKKALPSVVNVSTTRVVKTGKVAPSPFFSHPSFRDFFGPGRGWEFDMPQERRERGLGSGVIVSPEGYILTNDHVVSEASEITVALADKRELKAKLIGTDPKTDVAVLKVDETDLPHLPLGDSSTVEVGDIVLAMGNPFGIGQTVTMGIVSATGRGGLGIEDYEDFIQTDAAINRGNSGGPLINVRGEVVGINTAIISRTGGNVGIGFSIPSNMAHDVMDQLIDTGRVVRGWLGVSIQLVGSKEAEALDLDEARGALVGDVTSDSPASKAGLERGDVIVAVDSETVSEPRDLQLKIARAGPDAKVNLSVIRNGKEKQIPVTLEELPEERRGIGSESRRTEAMEGVEVDELTPQISRQLGLPQDTFGVVVTGVAPGSPASEAGLRRGDVIQEVNRKPVTNVQAFVDALRNSGGDPVMLLVNRAGSTAFVVVDPR